MMDLKEFRANAHRLADWMADYVAKANRGGIERVLL